MSLFTRPNAKKALSPPPFPLSSRREYDPDSSGKDKDKEWPGSMGMGYDVESGSTLPGPRTLRRVIQRRSRVIIGVLAFATVVLYYGPFGGGSYTPPPPPVVPAPLFELDDRLPVDNIWDDLPPPIEGAPPANAPAPPKRPPRPDDPKYYIIDQHGDHFLANIGRKIAPLHPAAKDLMDPDELFADVDLKTFLKKPVEKKFPDNRLRDISSDPLDTDKPWVKGELPKDSFAARWVAPAKWDAATPGVKKVQWPGFTNKDREWESKDQRAERLKRQAAVKRGFAYAWQKYKDAAWGHDEVKPVSGTPSDPFSGWGASIIDTLDTLLVLDMQDEYNLCRPHVNQLNFNWIAGKDWSQGYKAPESEGGWEVPRSSMTGLAVFESGIRYLGGLLGAYDLSGDQLMLDRAIDIAGILGRAFNTKSGLPQGTRIDPGAESGIYTLHGVSIAEVGSMTLELMRLSQATGDRQWFDLAQRAMDYIDTKAAPRSVFKPLLPMSFIPDGDSTIHGSFSFGAMTDSYYEYLIKTYKLLGGGELAKQYKRLYAESIDEARKVLFRDVTVVPNRDLMTIGKYEGGQLKLETEHLACFAGAMLGLGAKLLDRPKDMTDAGKFTTTCYWIGAGTPTGIQPEVVAYYDPDDKSAYINKTIYGDNLHPPIKQPWTDDQYDRNKMHKNQQGEIFWSDDRSPVRNDSGRKPGHPIAYYRYLQGNPPGAKTSTGYYINRPETIESVFYMYRLTGDRAWQDKGWRMFGSWMNISRVDHGISSIRDVTVAPDSISYGDNMESFIFAETFKYHYLLQSEPELLSLDDYVLNTEAHPLIANYGRDLEPGSQGLWDPASTEGQDLGVRGEGTHVQKWARDSHLKPTRERHRKGSQ